MREYIIFSNKNDYIPPFNTKRAKELITTLKASETYGINEIVELFNIKLYFEHFDIIPGLSTEEHNKLKLDFDILNPKIFKFINSLNTNNVQDRLNDINWQLVESFWKLADKCKLYKKNDSELFNSIIQIETIRKRIHNFKVSKEFINTFSTEIKNWISNISINTAIDIILHEHKTLKYDTSIKNLADTLSVEDKNILISRYLNESSPAPDDLMLIVNLQNIAGNIAISPKLKRKAYKKHDEIVNDFFTNHTGIPFGWDIYFKHFNNIDQDKIVSSQSDFISNIIYNLDYLDDTLDYPSILNNFIYVFNFTDIQMRSESVSLSQNLDIFEYFKSENRKNYYPIGIDFHKKNIRLQRNIQSYYSYLKNKNIHLEDVIEWFFHTYLPQELCIDGFKIKMPSKNTNYYEKCLIASNALESIIHQFELYVEEQEIDINLLQFKYGISYNQISSLVPNKYVYLTDVYLNNVKNILFGDGSILSDPDDTDIDDMDNFFDIIVNKNISLSNYHPSYHNIINDLIKNEIIYINELGFLKPKDTKLIYLLSKFYVYEVVCYQKESDIIKLKIDELCNKKLVNIESTLLTNQEADLFNYKLNKQSFYNGINLRNKYAHGAMILSSEDEHINNYMEFLRMIILLIIKINDEFDYLDNKKSLSKPL